MFPVLKKQENSFWSAKTILWLQLWPHSICSCQKGLDLWMPFVVNKEVGDLTLNSAKKIKKQNNTGKLEKGGWQHRKQSFLWQINWAEWPACGGVWVCDEDQGHDQQPGSASLSCVPVREVPGGVRWASKSLCSLFDSSELPYSHTLHYLVPKSASLLPPTIGSQVSIHSSTHSLVLSQHPFPSHHFVLKSASTFQVIIWYPNEHPS